MSSQIVISEAKCFFKGCKAMPVNHVTEKWGNKDTWCACAKHTPSILNRPEEMRDMPFAYIVTPIKFINKVS